MDKYYTPKNEEIHIGLEYERRDFDEENRWVKEALGFSSGWLEIPEDFAQNIRVKYLDKEDIEACGWCYKETSKGDYDYYWSNNKLHSILYNPHAKRMVI